MNPFFLEICPKTQNSKYFSLHGSTLSSYHIIISIVISYHHITSSYHIISKKLWKMTKSYCSWTLFSWKFAPRSKIQNIFPTRVNTIIISHHHIIASYHIIISHHHIISSVKNFEKWLSLTVHEPFFPGNLPQDPKFKIFFATRVNTIIISHHHIISSYHIIISHHHIISSVKKLWKMTKSQCSWTLFPLEICPKTRNSKIFHMPGPHYHPKHLWPSIKYIHTFKLL